MDELEQGEGLANLMPDIQNTANLVLKVTCSLDSDSSSEKEHPLEKKTFVSLEEHYLKIMKKLQFGMY